MYAIQVCKDGLKEYPDSADLWKYLAEIQHRHPYAIVSSDDDCMSIVEAYENAACIDKKDWRSLVQLGELYLEEWWTKPQPLKAMEAFLRAISCTQAQRTDASSNRDREEEEADDSNPKSPSKKRKPNDVEEKEEDETKRNYSSGSSPLPFPPQQGLPLPRQSDYPSLQ
eukprot:TRINITY_DN62399_c0_g1_i1.p2 TRINITY_DN62399_c0_g1~~TRINITY_DN62399_c0_g1_i1.p2  ORF type:complete len:169 (+),score=27.22 TRINITY_DN62399_c0_g1_i1:154-660(+)